MSKQEIEQRLRRDQCACRILVDITTRLADDWAGDTVRQVEILYAVAYMLDLVARSMEETRLALRNLEGL